MLRLNNKCGTDHKTHARNFDQDQYPKRYDRGPWGGQPFDPEDQYHWLEATLIASRKPFDYALVQYQFLKHKFTTGQIPIANLDRYQRTMQHFYNRLERDVRQSL